MNILQTMRVAIRALLRNKMRSFLTTLGIIIGVGAVIAMVAIGEGAKARVEAAFQSMGSNMLVVMSGTHTAGGAHGGFGSQPTLTWDDLKAILAEVPSVKAASPQLRATAQLLAVQRLLGDRFGRDFTLVTLSLGPEHDTPEAMRRYLSAHHARPGWTWLTGRRADIEAIRRFVGFTEPDPVLDADRARHTGLVLLGNDRTGRWSSVPALVPPEQIVDALLRTAGERYASAAPRGACPAR